MSVFVCPLVLYVIYFPYFKACNIQVFEGLLLAEHYVMYKHTFWGEMAYHLVTICFKLSNLHCVIPFYNFVSGDFLKHRDAVSIRYLRNPVQFSVNCCLNNTMLFINIYFLYLFQINNKNLICQLYVVMKQLKIFLNRNLQKQCRISLGLKNHYVTQTV